MDLLLFGVDQNYRRGQSKPFANLTEFEYTATELFNCVMEATYLFHVTLFPMQVPSILLL